jgi:hypothetical protein
MPLHGGLKIGFLASPGGSSMNAILQPIADDSLPGQHLRRNL